jgi:hypothetical protein
MQQLSPATILVLAVTSVLMMTAATPSATGSRTVVVTNARDSGPGSFRHAIARANADPGITHVVVTGHVGAIRLQSTVFFSGPQDLAINGTNATLDGAAAGGPALYVDGGGDLSVSSLTVQNAPGDGIVYQVPGGATGTVHLVLFNVTIRGNGGHGVLVNDQVDSTTPEPPLPPPDAGSDATVHVTVLNSRFVSNGIDPVHSVSDRDGLRVNEGGLGHLILKVWLSLATGNGADGIEVDERGPGDVRVDMRLSRLVGNGAFDPADLDDGFDIDEWNDGDITGTIVASEAIDNWEEGFDFNENHFGDLRVDMQLVEASGNREEGIDYEEDDDFAGGGDLVTTMDAVAAHRNGVDDGDGGLKIREKGSGDLQLTLRRAAASQNFISGIHIREDADGTLTAALDRATSTANAADGIVFDERSDGTLSASVARSTASNNGDDGIQADEAGAGEGALLLQRVTLAGNTDAATSGNVTPTVTP